jgi:IS5 family transposase
MNVPICLTADLLDAPAMAPFRLYREQVRPVLEGWREKLDGMYAPVIGRPPLDPVLLMGVTLLQALTGAVDRLAVEYAAYDVRWRLALGLPESWSPFDSSTLCRFRARLVRHGQARVALEAGLEAMRQTGYLKTPRAVRIDSTHVLGDLSAMSRLDCVRQTLRLALEFLAAWNGAAAWEPWFSRYGERPPEALRHAARPTMSRAMACAGEDMRELLARVDQLGEAVGQAQPIQLLRRVFTEQFVCADDGSVGAASAAPPGAVINPHDPEAQWSTKHTLDPKGWTGFKQQICETAAETPRAPREPTAAVITAVLTQPAITSDHGSLEPVLAEQAAAGTPAPATVFADAGYISGPALQRAEEQAYELCGPVGAPPHSATRFGSDAFAVDLPGRRAVCPAGKTSVECARITERGHAQAYYYFAWASADCGGCPLAAQCLSRKKRRPFRTLQVGEGHMRVQARRKLCQTSEYRLRMRRRSGIEGTISELARGYGIRRARYRGLAKTALQMCFAAAACNLRRWVTRLRWLAQNAPAGSS